MKSPTARAAMAVLATLALTGTVAATAHAAPTTNGYGRAELARDLRTVTDDGAVGAQGELRVGSKRIVATAGVADKKTRKKMPKNGHFRAASNTKTFTATIVLQLIGEGKLSLDDTVERRLPGVVKGNGNDGTKVTVRHLLQHTSGLYDFGEEIPSIRSEKDYLAHRFDHYELEDVAALAMKHKPNFYPDGKTWQYSNTNYTLAAMIVERVTGHDWYTELQNRILTPLDLRNTFPARDYPYLPKPSARGYERFEDKFPLVDVSAWNLSFLKGDGDIVTTTEDLTTFFAALAGGKLLKPAQWKQMTTTVKADIFDPLLPIGGYRYGLGLSWNPLTCGSGYWGHGGDGAGFTSRTSVTPNGRTATLYTSTTLYTIDQHRKLLKALDTALCSTPKAGSGTEAASVSTASYGKNAFQRDLDAITDGGVVGVQGRVDAGRRTHVGASGVADGKTSEKVAADGYLRAGSVTKPIVATVVLQLVGEGKLSLDDTVERWLPGVVKGNGNDGSKITVRQLLQHTSGLYNYTNDLPIDGKASYLEHRFDHYDDADLVATAMKHQPDFKPGSKWSYCNTGYVLAGMIIKKITGNSWETEVQSRISNRLGMSDTFTPGDYPYLPGTHAKGYHPDENGKLFDATVDNHTWGDAAGALITTTADLEKFWQGLQSGTLLKPAQLAQMRKTVQAKEFWDVWPNAGYGLGIMWIPLESGGGYWGHGGDTLGFKTRSGVSADGKRSVVLSLNSQTSGLATEQRVNRLMDRAF